MALAFVMTLCLLVYKLAEVRMLHDSSFSDGVKVALQ